jgi:hypothetical protein
MISDVLAPCLSRQDVDGDGTVLCGRDMVGSTPMDGAMLEAAAAASRSELACGGVSDSVLLWLVIISKSWDFL